MNNAYLAAIALRYAASRLDPATLHGDLGFYEPLVELFRDTGSADPWREAAYNNQYLKVGHKVAIEGDLQYRKWKDQHGQDRITAEIVARSVEFLTPQSKDGADGGTAPSQPTTQPASQQGSNTNYDDDDLPF